MRNEIKFIGSFHSVSIAPTARLEIGRWVEMRNFSSLDVFAGATLKLGDSVFINEHCTIRCAHYIEIGNETMLGDGVRIYDQDHLYSSYRIDRWTTTKRKVKIGNSCWIGANVVILKGVSIGDNVIIGAGTVVTKDIPSNTIVYGQKNLVIKERRRNGHHAFVYTASDRIEHLAYLLEHLPDVDFHIAAPTNISEYLLSFNSYPNCHLYTRYYGDDKIWQLINQADVYLDINHSWEVDGVLNKVFSQSKPVVAFTNTIHRAEDKQYYTKIVSNEEPCRIVKEIKKIISK